MITLLGWNGGAWELIFNDLGPPTPRKVFCLMYRESESSDWKRFPSIMAYATAAIMEQAGHTKIMLANPSGENLTGGAVDYYHARTVDLNTRTPTEVETEQQNEHATEATARGSSGGDHR